MPPNSYAITLASFSILHTTTICKLQSHVVTVTVMFILIFDLSLFSRRNVSNRRCHSAESGFPLNTYCNFFFFSNV